MRSYLEATTYLCDAFEDLIVNGDFKYGESTFISDTLMMTRIIKIVKLPTSDTVKSGRKMSSFSLEPIVAKALTELAETDESFFDCCAEVCELNLIANAPLSAEMRIFAARVVSGDLTRPTKKSRPFKKNWTETSLMLLGALDVAERFNLTLTRNDEGSNRSSACDAVAEALTVCGRKTKYSEIKYLAVHPDKKKFREQVDVSRKLAARIRSTGDAERELGSEGDRFLQEAVLTDVVDIAVAYFTDDQISSFET